jgi:hypothetical protein
MAKVDASLHLIDLEKLVFGLDAHRAAVAASKLIDVVTF